MNKALQGISRICIVKAAMVANPNALRFDEAWYESLQRNERTITKVISNTQTITTTMALNMLFPHDTWSLYNEFILTFVSTNKLEFHTQGYLYTIEKLL